MFRGGLSVLSAVKKSRKTSSDDLNLAKKRKTEFLKAHRVLDARNTSVTLNTFSKTAAAIGYKLKVELVSA